METRTDNEIIAEFMGGTHEAREIMTVGGKRTGKWTFQDGLWCYDDQLDYDVSWSRLMPVVEKIFMLRNTKMKMSVGSLEISSLPYVNGGLYFSISVCEPNLTGIQCYHKAVVEFIKWYSNQSQKAS